LRGYFFEAQIAQTLKLLKRNFAICAQYAQTPISGWWCYTRPLPKDGCAEKFLGYPNLDHTPMSGPEVVVPKMARRKGSGAQ